MIALAAALLQPDAIGWQARYQASYLGEPAGVVVLEVLRNPEGLTVTESLTQRSESRTIWTVETRTYAADGTPKLSLLKRRDGESVSELRAEFVPGGVQVSSSGQADGVIAALHPEPADRDIRDHASLLLGLALPAMPRARSFARFSMNSFDWETVELAFFAEETVRLAAGSGQGRRVALGAGETWWLDGQGMPLAIRRVIEDEELWLRREGQPRARREDGR